MDMILLFDSGQEARDYRHTHGTGGWIFIPDPSEPMKEDMQKSILFPPSYPPSRIFNHPMTKGREGNLVGSQ